MTQEQAYKSLQWRVRKAHIRYCGLSFYFYLMKFVFYALVLACLATGIMKLLPQQGESYNLWVPGIILVFSIPAALYTTWRRLGSLNHTAMMADKHLHLKEKISSALELSAILDVPPQELEWNKAVLRDAVQAVSRLNLKKAFPLTHPKEFRWMWAPVLVLLLTVFIIPQWDALTGPSRQAQAEEIEHKEVKKELQRLMQRQLILEKKAQEDKTKIASKLSKEMKELTMDLSKGKIEKREALAKLSSLEQEWEKRKQQLEQLKPEMKEELKTGLQPKMTNELVEALEKNDFEKAANALNKLQKQIKMGDLDEKGIQQLSEELKKLASAMNMDLPMIKALENAGQMLQTSELDAALKPLQLAEMSMQDLKDLLEQMALLDGALNDLKNAKFALSGKFGKCEKCGKFFGEGEGFCNGSCLGNGKRGVSESTNPWKPGESRKQGNGMGGPGIGRGGQAPFKETSTQLTPDKLKAMFGNAPIQAMLPVDGAALKGNAKVGVNDAALFEYSQESEEALTKERVPLPLRNQVRLYFETAKAGETSGNSSDNATEKTTENASQSSRPGEESSGS